MPAIVSARSVRLLALSTVAAALALATPASAADAKSTAPAVQQMAPAPTAPQQAGSTPKQTAAQQPQITAEALVDALRRNPTMIVDAFLLGHEAMRRDNELRTTMALEAALLETRSGTMTVGSKDAKHWALLIDAPGCVPCRAVATELLDKAAAGVLLLTGRTLPASDEGGDVPSRVLYAADRAGRWGEVFQAFTRMDKIDAESAVKKAREIGLDPERLKADAASPGAYLSITRTTLLASLIGARSLPIVLIDGRVVQATPEGVREGIEEARKNLAKLEAERAAKQETANDGGADAKPQNMR